MNIAVIRNNGAVYCRPDTSWEREPSDLYMPDGVSGYHYVPVVFARLCKAGKCIARRFSRRYYDSAGFGVLLYDSGLLDGSADSTASASCADRTTFLPMPLFSLPSLEDGEYVLMKDGMTLFRTVLGSSEIMDEALEKISSRVSLRIGDIVAIELGDVNPLCGRSGQVSTVSATYCGEEILKFTIIS